MTRALLLAALVTAGCEELKPTWRAAPAPPPDLTALVKVDGPTLTCDDALVACTPLDAPTTCSCFWTCVQNPGVAEYKRVVFTYTRRCPKSDWERAYARWDFGRCAPGEH